VIAMGNPLGDVGAIASGMVHSRGSGELIETNVRLAPGNSGGPLADAEGRIVGINTCIANGMGVAVGTRRIIPFVERVAGSRN
jgi:serine protease Do